LRESGDLRYLAVGSDFRCGHRLDTGAEEIREYGRTAGIDAELLSPVLWSGHPVSSSRIRKAIAERRLEDAKAMLGRSYEIDLRGAPVLGYRDGELEISTDGRQALPPDGLYESIARGAGGEVEARARLDKGIWSLATAEGLEPRALRLLS
jgi:riboflavin kinase/FMN adenylyltransferase